MLKMIIESLQQLIHYININKYAFSVDFREKVYSNLSIK